jgi:precorrin-6A/cobalt-precorrin-6A reductase
LPIKAIGKTSKRHLEVEDKNTTVICFLMEKPAFRFVFPGNRIWLIGGTQESTRIAAAIASAGFPCTVTVTTATAQGLYPQSPSLKVCIGSLDSSQLATFCTQEQIVGIVDASHPFAVAISRAAIAVGAARQIPYLRYERSSLLSTDTAIELDSFDSLLQGNYLLGQRVLLTIGYKALPLFQPWQERATLFTRLLPGVNSLEVAMAAGFTPDRIMAIRPPIGAELEKALWRQWQISLVVTKASGEAGGEAIKRAVAAALGIPIVVITRPKVAYPQQTSDLSDVLAFCHQQINPIKEIYV